LRDLYLQLDISNSNYEMIPDNISSGNDQSASNYIISSSYANGLLIRPTSNIEAGAVAAATSSLGLSGLSTPSSTSTASSTPPSSGQTSSTPPTSISTPSSSGPSYSSGY